MATIPIFIKDPNATLDYGVDWRDWLESGETIASVEWTVESGLTSGTESESGGIAKVWLSGGTVDNTYLVTCRVTTSNSPARIEDRSFNVKVESR